jgi:hypothetical protein
MEKRCYSENMVDEIRKVVLEEREAEEVDEI